MRETLTPSIPSHRLLDLAATTAPPHTVPLLRALALLEEACADLRLGLLEEGAAARPAAAEAIAARLEALLTAVPTVPSSLALLLALLDLIPRDHRRDEPPDTGPALRRALEAALPRDGRPGPDQVPFFQRSIEDLYQGKDTGLFRDEDTRTPVVWTVHIQDWPGPIEFRGSAGSRRAVLSCYHTGKAVTGGSDPDLRAWLRHVGANVLGLRVTA